MGPEIWRLLHQVTAAPTKLRLTIYLPATWVPIALMTGGEAELTGTCLIDEFNEPARQGH